MPNSVPTIAAPKGSKKLLSGGLFSSPQDERRHQPNAQHPCLISRASLREARRQESQQRQPNHSQDARLSPAALPEDPGGQPGLGDQWGQVRQHGGPPVKDLRAVGGLIKRQVNQGGRQSIYLQPAQVHPRQARSLPEEGHEPTHPQHHRQPGHETHSETPNRLADADQQGQRVAVSRVRTYIEVRIPLRGKKVVPPQENRVAIIVLQVTGV